MGVSTLHYLHAIVSASPAFAITELSDAQPSTNLEELVGRAAGSPYPVFRSIRGGEPSASFQTPQLKSLVSNLATGGFAGDVSGGNLDLYYRRATDKGVRELAASMVHQGLRAANAMIVVDQIRAVHQQDAEASARIIPLDDGSNPPIQFLGDVALAGSHSSNEWYTLAPVKLNGSTLAGVQDWTFSLGLTLQVRGSEGEEFPSYVTIQEINPTVTINLDDLPEWIGTGYATALTSMELGLRAKNQDDENVALGNLAHIKITHATSGGGVISADNLSGGATQAASATIRVGLRSPDPETIPFAISVDQALA